MGKWKDPFADFNDDDFPETDIWADVKGLTGKQRDFFRPTTKGGKSYTPCSHPPTKVFEVDGVQFFAARERDLRTNGMDLIINCTGSRLSGSGAVTLHNAGDDHPLQGLTVQPVPELLLDWDNYKAPPVEPEFWGQLISAIKRAKMRRVCVFCFGGHGRTGTALASILAVATGSSGPMAQIEVRQFYCGKAVESKEQEAYLKKIKSHVILTANGKGAKVKRASQGGKK